MWGEENENSTVCRTGTLNHHVTAIFIEIKVKWKAPVLPHKGKQDLTPSEIENTIYFTTTIRRFTMKRRLYKGGMFFCRAIALFYTARIPLPITVVLYILKSYIA